MGKLKDYLEKQVQAMKLVFPDIEEDVLRENIREVMLERNKQNEKYTFNMEFNDANKTYLKAVAISAIEKKLEKEFPIITRYGTCFCRQEEKQSLLALMCKYLTDKRDSVKGEMFTHRNDEDKTIYKVLDIIQKTIKIINNSIYGVLTAKGSIFRSLMCGESVTHSGELIIMTAISMFERFITNNLRFYSISDIIQYVTNIVNETYDSEERYDMGFDLDIDADFVYDYLCKHLADRETVVYIGLEEKNNLLYDLLSNLDEADLYKIYFKNNLEEFFKHSYIIIGDEPIMYLSEFEEIFKTTFMNPNKPDEQQQKHLDTIWIILKDWVFYNYQNAFKRHECKVGSRRTVTIVDTDSNILFLGAFYLFFKNMFPEIIDNSREKMVTSINTITYPLTEVIKGAYWDMTTNCNIPETHRGLIKMKNEFLFDKVLLTKNKKSYATSVIMQEGILLKEAEIEIKGMKIKKTDTNKSVRMFFQKLLEDNILRADVIDYPEIISKYFKFGDELRAKLEVRNAEYGIPGNCSELDSYKDPYNVIAVRGACLWNILFPENELSFPTKVHMLKLNITNDIELIENTIRDYYETNEIKLNELKLKEFLERMQEALNTEQLFKSGVINVISYDKSLKKIPHFIMPFVDIEGVVNAHLNTGAVLLDSLGIQTPKINNKLVPTNIIKL